MVDNRAIKMQLAAIDHELPFWVNPEIKQLSKIIVPEEIIMQAINGRYEGGIALLCATNLRILIVDKKPLFLSVEDVRYDMIAEVDYTHQLFDGTIHLATFNKDLWFRSFKKHHLRSLTDHIQQMLSDIRQRQQAGDNQFAIAGEMNQQQAREFLPSTQQAWDRVSDKLDRINAYTAKPTMIRRRIAKFDSFN